MGNFSKQAWGDSGKRQHHYYPGREQAVECFERENLAILDEGFRRDNGWGYRHFLLRASQ